MILDVDAWLLLILTKEDFILLWLLVLLILLVVVLLLLVVVVPPVLNPLASLRFDFLFFFLAILTILTVVVTIDCFDVFYSDQSQQDLLRIWYRPCYNDKKKYFFWVSFLCFCENSHVSEIIWFVLYSRVVTTGCTVWYSITVLELLTKQSSARGCCWKQQDTRYLISPIINYCIDWSSRKKTRHNKMIILW